MTVARKRAFSYAALLGALIFAPACAQAQSETFVQARDAYRAADYAQTIELLRPLVGDVTPSISDAVIVREARKYLGAALVLDGHAEEGAQQFEWLLGEVAGTRTGERRTARLRSVSMNPRRFVQEVRVVFERVQRRLIDETESESALADEAEARRLREERDAILAILDMAQSVEIEVENDELPAWVPFGVGQFTNGDDDLGWFFAISEGVTALGALGLMPGAITINDIIRHDGHMDSHPLSAVGQGMWISGIVSVVALAVLAIAGVIEARLSWRPTRTIRRQREVPQDVLDRLPLGAPQAGAVMLRF